MEKSTELATSIYQLTQNYPKHETYGIVSQMRHSAVSISSNIAEGAGRSYSKEFSRFLRIAYESACEFEAQLSISQNLNFISVEVYSNMITRVDEIQKVISALKKD